MHHPPYRIAVRAFVILSTLAFQESVCNYRHFFVDNADLCKGTATSGLLSAAKKPKVLDVGSSATILKLSSPSHDLQPNYLNRDVRCEILLQAPEGFGLAAYVEEMHLRENTKTEDCEDYVQFGEKDIIPFVTLRKSKKICGQRSAKLSKDSDDYVFDDETGSMIVWFNFGGRRKFSYRPEISVVNLTLIVTPYQKDCGTPLQNYLRCGTRDKCIWKFYFCDKHINCPTDIIPVDEDQCEFHSTAASNDLGGPPGGGIGKGIGAYDGVIPRENAYVAVIAVLLVCCGVLVATMACVILVHRSGTPCIQKACPCLYGAIMGGTAGSCDLPEQQAPRSLTDLDRRRHLRDTEQNIYLPLNAFAGGGQTGDGGAQQTTILENSRPEGGGGEEPPPAYEELFPRRNLAENLSDSRRRNEETGEGDDGEYVTLTNNTTVVDAISPPEDSAAEEEEVREERNAAPSDDTTNRNSASEQVDQSP